MKKILIIAGRYLPGYKDGGPVRTIINLTDYLGDEYAFRILTCDRDHGDRSPYPGIKVNDWNPVGKAQVYYVRPNGFSMKKIMELSRWADIVYSCGVFSPRSIKVFILSRFKLIKCPVVVATMGMFSPKEFRLKYAKKKAFTTLFNLTGMFRNVYWSATSELEVSEILQELNVKRERFFIAEDLPRKVKNDQVYKEKKSGYLDVVWISRIAPKKNLLSAIEILKKVSGNVTFHIYGPTQDEEYWEKCKQALSSLPSNVSWSYCGMLDSDNVVETLKMYHIFLFPTLGENYGHVIQEALSAGCPVVLSDQTPWRDLESHNAGAVYPLEDSESFVRKVEQYCKMDATEFNREANAALTYAIACSNDKVKNTGYRKIFDTL